MAKGNKSKQHPTTPKRALADDRGIIEWRHFTLKAQHGLDFTTVASHSHIWLGRVDMENMGEGLIWACTKEHGFDLVGRIRDFVCIIQRFHLAPTLLSLQISA